MHLFIDSAIMRKEYVKRLIMSMDWAEMLQTTKSLLSLDPFSASLLRKGYIFSFKNPDPKLLNGSIDQ